MRACMLELYKSWEETLLMIKFVYNNKYRASISRTPCEDLHGRSSKSPLLWNEIRETITLAPDMVKESNDQVRVIQEKMRAPYDQQETYADKKRPFEEFEVRKKVF